MRSNRRLETPTFAQTVAIIQAMPLATRPDCDAIIERHLTLGFHYSKDQIYRALAALTDPARRYDQHKRRSARST